MADRGQRTTIKFGGVAAEVSLLKTSGKPKSAQHETKRFVVEQAPASAPASPALAAAPSGASSAGAPSLRDELAGVFSGTSPAEHEASETESWSPPVAEQTTEVGGSDAFGDDPAPAVPKDLPPAETTPGPTLPPEPRPDETPGQREAREQTEEEPPSGMFARTAPAAEYVAPETRVEQGIHLEDGTWVDLTAHLDEVDERTKLDGLEVIATIGVSTIPRERVRDAYYVAGAEASQYKVLGLIWHALRQTDRAAVVRWTKRTAQACGIVVARGTLGEGAHLVLLEVEWAENMRAPGPKVLGPIKTLTATDPETGALVVAPDERAAAVDLAEAFEAGPSALNDLRDERLGKRAELLARAKAGTLKDYTPPAAPEPVTDDMGLLEALQASVQWRREHAAS